MQQRHLVVRLVGPEGLEMELFRQMLVDAGVTVAGDAPEVDVRPRVTVLIDPRSEHWSSAKGDDVPIVLVVGEEVGDDEVVGAVLAGAEAVLSGDSSPATVVSVLEAVGRGGSVLDPSHVRAVAGLARAAAAQPSIVLSKREGEILASIERGEAVKQTARALGISPKTVENLQGRLFRKLGVRNRAQAVARAHELGLL